MGKVFSDLSILREQPSDVDLLDYKEEINRVTQRVKNARDNRRNTIIAYLGDYGMGKSQVLKIVENKLDKKEYEWLFFESWRYSSRQDLWQYFTELISAQLVGNRFTRWLKKYWMDLVVAALFILSIYVAFVYQPGSWDAWLIRYIKYAAGIILASIVGYLIAKYIHPKSPLARVEEFEALLRRAIKKSKKTLVVVIEDIDRTGDDGVTFMESLSVFLKNNNFDHSVLAIAPQKNTILNPLASATTDIRPVENGVKIYDESMYLSVEITADAIKNFYKSIPFTKEYKKHELAMEWITNELMYYNYSYLHNGQLSIRMLKYALRSVEYFIEANPNYNPAVAFVIVLSGLMQAQDGNNRTGKSAYSSITRQTSIPGTNSWSPSELNFWQLCMQVAIESTYTNRSDFYEEYIGSGNSGVIKNINPGRTIKIFTDGLDGDGKILSEDTIDTSPNANRTNRIEIRIRREYLQLVT